MTEMVGRRHALGSFVRSGMSVMIKRDRMWCRRLAATSHASVTDVFQNAVVAARGAAARVTRGD